MPIQYLDLCFHKSEDRHAKKNRDSKAQGLRDQGYHVTCSRTTDVRGRSIYEIHADKNSIEQPVEVIQNAF